MLKNQPYPNNSYILISEVGEGDNALICETKKEDCCGTRPNRFGEFYYPSGAEVRRNSAGDGLYRNRGSQVIRLNKRIGVTAPLGEYICELPDKTNVMQRVVFNLVTSIPTSPPATTPQPTEPTKESPSKLIIITLYMHACKMQ